MIPAYFRLEKVDGASPPIEVDYGTARCVITDGDLVLKADRTGASGGDGMICIRLFGTTFGIPTVHVIHLQREPFDRLNEEHLTFPGGFRHKQAIPPHSVVHCRKTGIDVNPLTATDEVAGSLIQRHRWRFLPSREQLADSDMTVE